jgi:hypothetical protein
MTEQVDKSDARLGRRAVVRTAAHAAWAVPAIQIATSVSASAAVCSATTTAPAKFAVTGSTTQVILTAQGRYNVTNSGKAGTAQLTLTASGVALNLTAPSVGGWAFASRSGNTFIYTKLIGACGVTTANFDLLLSAGLFPTWTATVSP